MSNSLSSDSRRPSPFLVLICFIVVVGGGGVVMGFLTGPDAWYAGLVKPPFNPPNWIFAPVWTTLYIMIAISGWRIWRVAPKSVAMVVWVMQMILNWAWTPTFFSAHDPQLALAVILALLLAIIVFIIKASRLDRVASVLFVPYAIWVSFATLLNAWIAFLN